MSPDRWREVERLYHAALERDPEVRATFLASASGGDEELLDEVQSLLEQHSGDSRLDRAVWETSGESTDTRFAAGTQLGQYRIEAPLGAGGMGEVFRARDTRLNRTVAIKISKQRFTGRFKQEARAVAALNHPNIVQIYELGSEDGDDFIVMEFVPGRALAELLPVARLSLDHALEYANQIASALAAAHAAGIVHRDIKPGNIIVTDAGVIKILDFGIAKVEQNVAAGYTSSTIDPQTGSRTVLGTAAYMSPEQAEGKAVDARSDIFSTGALFYEMLTGSRALDGDSTLEVLTKVFRETPRGIRELRPEAPEAIARIISRCLEKNPALRYASGKELAGELLLCRRPARAALTGRAGMLIQRPEAPRRRISPWAAGVAALLVLFAGASWMALHRSPAPPVKPTQFLVAPPKGYYLEGGGIRQSFALSPDGGRIAFTAKDASGSFRLFLRDFSELESRPVADGEGAYSVVWTPDGQMLLFTGKGKLRRIAVNAAASQILSDDVPYFSSAIPFGPDRLLVSNPRNSGVIPSSGGTPHPIDRLYSWAQMLPGGRDFLYTIDDPQLGSQRARIATTGGNDPGVEVVQADSRVQYTASLRSDGGYLVYLRAGTLLAQPFDLAGLRVTAEPRAITRRVPSFGSTGAADFSVSRRGVLAYQSYINRSQFIWVDRTGKRLSTASPAEISATYARLSPDGRWLAAVPFDIERGVPEIWLYDAVSGAGRKVVFGPDIPGMPVWSPDSRRLVYTSGRIWPRLGLISFDGAPDKEALPDTGFMAPTDWSPDGRFILYNNSALPAITQRFPSDVFAIDMARNRKVIPLLSTPFYEYNAVFSPDGKWLAFLSTESGQAEVYMQALDRGNDSLRVTGDRFLISRPGGQCLRWRKNGRELYYLGSDGRVYAVPLAFGAGSVRAGQPEPLFTIDAEARAAIHNVVSFDVSADGSRFVIPSMTPGDSSALVVMQDWESLVAK